MGVNEAEIEILDLTGLKCPLPALYARKALERGGPGTTVTVVSDDPMAAVDLPHMCTTEGYTVVSSACESGVIRMVLRRPA